MKAHFESCLHITSQNYWAKLWNSYFLKNIFIKKRKSLLIYDLQSKDWINTYYMPKGLSKGTQQYQMKWNVQMKRWHDILVYYKCMDSIYQTKRKMVPNPTLSMLRRVPLWYTFQYSNVHQRLAFLHITSCYTIISSKIMTNYLKDIEKWRQWMFLLLYGGPARWLNISRWLIYLSLLAVMSIM